MCARAFSDVSGVSYIECMSRRRRYKAIVRFPWGLPVSSDCLGTHLRARIDGRPGELSLPVRRGDEQLAAPVARDGKPLAVQLDNRVRSYPDAWGYPGNPGTWYVKAAAVSLLLEPEEVSGATERLMDLQHAFVSWSRIVVEWASAWSRELMMGFEIDNDPILHVYSDDGVQLSLSNPRSRTMIVRDVRPMNLAQLTGAIARASKGDRLPVEHLTLLYAEDAMAAGDLRKSVIDAATATEVALAATVRSRLQSKQNHLSSEFIDEVIKDVNGIANLYSLCERLGEETGVSSKTRLTTQLANVRNRAAHAGKEPTLDETDTAVELAMTIVRTLRPLPLA